MNKLHIGVFDSGKGGQLVAARLEAILPGYEWSVVNDATHVPYGEKDKETIISLTDAAIQPLLTNCPIIVIACNTATTAAITELRLRYPDTKFVGVEPMIKPATSESIKRHITVLATPYTLNSTRYLQLKEQYGKSVIVDEPNTTGWPKLIDDSKRDEIILKSVDQSVNTGSDTIALACTHYLDLIETLKRRYPNIRVLEPSEAVARQIQRLTQAL